MTATPNHGLRISIADVAYVVAPGDLGPLDASDYRRATGTNLRAAFEGINRDGSVDLDQLCGLAWLMARRADPGLTYETFISGITYQTRVSLELAEQPDPET